jgi:hypothetical protein
MRCLEPDDLTSLLRPQFQQMSSNTLTPGLTYHLKSGYLLFLIDGTLIISDKEIGLNILIAHLPKYFLLKWKFNIESILKYVP